MLPVAHLAGVAQGAPVPGLEQLQPWSPLRAPHQVSQLGENSLALCFQAQGSQQGVGDSRWDLRPQMRRTGLVLGISVMCRVQGEP